MQFLARVLDYMNMKYKTEKISTNDCLSDEQKRKNIESIIANALKNSYDIARIYAGKNWDNLNKNGKHIAACRALIRMKDIADNYNMYYLNEINDSIWQNLAYKYGCASDMNEANMVAVRMIMDRPEYTIYESVSTALENNLGPLYGELLEEILNFEKGINVDVTVSKIKRLANKIDNMKKNEIIIKSKENKSNILKNIFNKLR